MGSGEADAIREVPIKNYYSPSTTTTSNSTINSTFQFDYDWNKYTWPNTTYWTNTIYVDRYQVKCPEKGCKTFNWLVVDRITPCKNCGAKLKAVIEQADFEVPVDK